MFSHASSIFAVEKATTAWSSLQAIFSDLHPGQKLVENSSRLGSESSLWKRFRRTALPHEFLLYKFSSGNSCGA